MTLTAIPELGEENAKEYNVIYNLLKEKYGITKETRYGISFRFDTDAIFEEMSIQPSYARATYRGTL